MRAVARCSWAILGYIARAARPAITCRRRRVARPRARSGDISWMWLCVEISGARCWKTEEEARVLLGAEEETPLRPSSRAAVRRATGRHHHGVPVHSHPRVPRVPPNGAALDREQLRQDDQHVLEYDELDVSAFLPTRRIHARYHLYSSFPLFLVDSSWCCANERECFVKLVALSWWCTGLFARPRPRVWRTLENLLRRE